jgi:hypothetical protein
MPMATALTRGAAPIFPFRIHGCILERTLNQRVTQGHALLVTLQAATVVIS